MTPDSRPASTLHQQRDLAEAFSADVERYNRTRATCPPEILSRLVPASASGTVLDVGCGTGIVARQFQESGYNVLGVEPDVRMAEFARQTGVEVEVATFEAWDRAGRQFDTVTAGSAWHWVEPLRGATKAAEALKPGGQLAPFWHMYELPVDVAAAYASALRPVAPGSTFETWLSPQKKTAYEGVLSSVTDGIRQSGRFADPRRFEQSWERRYSRQEWLDHMLTQGFLTNLPPARQDEILGSAGEAIDSIGGSFTLSYTTVALTARKTS